MFLDFSFKNFPFVCKSEGCSVNSLNLDWLEKGQVQLTKYPYRNKIVLLKCISQ